DSCSCRCAASVVVPPLGWSSVPPPLFAVGLAGGVLAAVLGLGLHVNLSSSAPRQLYRAATENSYRGVAQREFRADGRGPRDEPSRVPLPLLWPRPSDGPRAEMADRVCTRRGPRAAQWTRALSGEPALPFILRYRNLFPH